MHLFAALGLVFLSSTVPTKEQMRSVTSGYVLKADSTPSEPPAAFLVMTGVAGIALVRRRKNSAV